MKIVFKHKDLVKALSGVAEIAKTQTAIPITNNFLFTTKPTVCQIQANNLDVIGNAVSRCTSDAEDKFLLPVGIYETLKVIPVEELEFNVAGNQVKITAGLNTLEYTIENHMEFPKPMEGYRQGLTSIILDKAIAESIETATHFTDKSKDQLRPALGAVCVDVNKKGIFIYATDGYSLYRNNFNRTGDVEKSILLPKTLHGLIKSMTKDVNLSLVFSPTSIGIKSATDGVEYFVKPMVATAPKYDAVIPKEQSFENEFVTKELLQIVDIAITMNEDRASAMIFGFEPKKIALEREELEKGRAYKTTLTPKYTDKMEPKEPIRVGVNVFFTKKILSMIKGTNIQVGFTSESRAMTMVPKVEGVRMNELFLIMPLNLNK